MYYFDDYPCGRCPYNEPAYGHCAYDEDCCFEDEEMEQQCYVDTCDDNEDDAPDDNESDNTDEASSVIVIDPSSTDDLDDLPILSLVHGVPRPRLSSHAWDDCANEGEDDDYDPDDYSEDDEDEEEEYDPDDYADYYNDDDYDSDDNPLKTASSKPSFSLDDYLF